VKSAPKGILLHKIHQKPKTHPHWGVGHTLLRPYPHHYTTIENTHRADTTTNWSYHKVEIVEQANRVPLISNNGPSLNNNINQTTCTSHRLTLILIHRQLKHAHDELNTHTHILTTKLTTATCTAFCQ